MPPPDAPGWEAVSELLSDLQSKARAYDEWRASVKVYNALDDGTGAREPSHPQAAREGEEPAGEDATPPTASISSSMAYYARLLEGVEPERLNVPVIMHALLEQVWK